MAARSAVKAASTSATQDETPLPKRRFSLWSLLGVLAACILLVFSAYLAHKQIAAAWETHLFQKINNLPDWLRPVARIASIMPNSTWIAVVVVAGAFSLRRWRFAWQLAVLVISGFGLVWLTKHIYHWPAAASMLRHAHGRWQVIGGGFPSAHMMIVTLTMLLVMTRVKPVWRVLAVLPIIIMGFVQMYLGVSTPSSVAGGFAIGMLIVCICGCLPRRWLIYAHMGR